MSNRKCTALVVDLDPEALITLQRTLEDGGVDTTVTWDDGEAKNLANQKSFDVIIVGDHPPELPAEAAVRDFRRHGATCRYLVLQSKGGSNSERLGRVGIADVVSKREPHRVLESVHKHCF